MTASSDAASTSAGTVRTRRAPGPPGTAQKPPRPRIGSRAGIAEILGSGPISPSALQRLCCNADLSVVLFADKLTPLYETTPSRTLTAAQRHALIARDGACIGCGAAPHQCEAHHIIPWACRGKTRLDNLVLVCWHCHDLIHDHDWKVIRRGDRYRLRPPNFGCSDEPAASSTFARRPAGPDSAADPQVAQAAMLTGVAHHQPMLC
ncbi:HNH endonuclease signature motif containing protein [Candidatus Poriferisodalis sp.]|uniref:HNH endonuclease signature motif containing protein n=1 Tax=Candidatus Poriferisodalis sp. TaxID=3101277 RepID=UPI003B024EA8